MTDYTELNERFKKLLEENNILEEFEYTGKEDHWRYKNARWITYQYDFFIHNMPMTIEGLLHKVYTCGCQVGRDEQVHISTQSFNSMLRTNRREYY